MSPMDDALTLIRDKKEQFGDLYSRMDKDRDLLYGVKYVMRDNAGEPVPNTHHVTLPFPEIFFGRVVAMLSSATQQVELKSKSLTDKQTTMIENFLDDLDYEVDTRLEKRGSVAAALLHWQRICARGSIGARCCLREDTKGIVLDILPLDMRHVTYEYSSDGLAWYANQPTRSRQEILKDYGIDINKKQAEVLDFWNEKTSEVWIENIMTRKQKNPYGYVPAVISVAPTGYWLDDDQQIAHQGESIFGIVRALVPEANRMASIWATLTELAYNNNMQYGSKEGTTAKQPEQIELDVPKVFPVDIGGGYKGMPIEDTNKAAQMLWALYNELLQMATISNANYGVLQFPLSGVAISSMTEAKDKILVPCLQGYTSFKRALAQMAIRQMVDQKISAELGQSGNQRTYSYRELKGDYSISYRFFSISKEQMVADASIANAMGNNVSKDYIRREIFKLPDPDGEKRKVDLEQLEITNPLIGRIKIVDTLIDEDRDIEARIIAHEVLTMIRNGQVGMAIEPPKPNTKDLIPLLEAGGTSSRPPAQSTSE